MQSRARYAAAQSVLELVGWALWLRVVAGLLMIALGLQVALGWRLVQPLEKIGAQAWRKLAPLMQHAPRHPLAQTLFLGSLWGCAVRTGVLDVAVGALGGTALHGASVMLAFGAGTLPAMLSSRLLTSQLARLAGSGHSNRKLKWLAGGLMLLFGAWTTGVALSHNVGHGVHHH
jgi:sulfite exporter TauE/SafE